MGRPGQSEKAVQQVLQLFQNRAANNMSVNDIVKVPGVPRATVYAKRGFGFHGSPSDQTHSWFNIIALTGSALKY